MAAFDFQSFLSSVSGVQGSPVSEAPSMSEPLVASPVDTTPQRGPLRRSSTSLEERVAATANSGAVNAVAAAAAAGTSTGPPSTRPTPQGRELPAAAALEYNVDERLPGEAQPQLEVSTITLLKHELQYELLRRIAANDQYICYGMKQGHIRVLNKLSADRALFKSHTQPISDLRFFSESVNLLASGGSDGQACVWRVSEREGHIAEEKVLVLRLSSTAGPLGAVRLAWHPTSENLLGLAAGPVVLVCSISELAPGGAAELDVNVDSLPSGVVALPLLGDGGYTDVAFSANAKLLAAASSDGQVRIWMVPTGKNSSRVLADLPSAEQISVLCPFGNQPMGSIAWLPGPDDSESVSVLVTGNQSNSQLKLWALDDGPADCLQTLTFSESAGGLGFFQHLVLQPASSLLILANAKRNAVYAVHVSGRGRSTRLDYIAEFSVTMPILSISANQSLAPAGPRVSLYCIQTQAIQEYLLDPAMSLPGATAAASMPPQAALTAVPVTSKDAQPAAATPAEARAQPASTREPSVENDVSKSKPEPSQVDANPKAAPIPAERPSPALGATANGHAAEAAPPPEPPAQAAAAPAPSVGPSASATQPAEAPLAPEQLQPAAPASQPVSIPLAEAKQPGRGKAPLPATPPTELAPLMVPLPNDVPQPRMLTPTQLIAQNRLAALTRSASLNSNTSDPATLQARPSSPAAAQIPAGLEVGAHTPALPAPVSSTLAAGPPTTAAASPMQTETPEPGSNGRQKPVKLLKRPGPPSGGRQAAAKRGEQAKELSVAAAAATEAQATAVSEATAEEAGPQDDADRQAALEERVTGAVGDRIAGLHNKLLQHISSSQRELLKAVRSELNKEGARLEAASQAQLAKLVREQKAVVEKERKALVAEERANMEKLLVAISASINRDLPLRIEDIIKREVSGGVGAAVQAALRETLPKELLGGALQQALEAALAAKLAPALTRPLQDNFRSSFQQQLVPKFEAACQSMFAQVQATFAGGLSEHLQAAGGATAAVADSLRDSLAQASAVVAKLSTDVAEGQRQLVQLARQQAQPKPGGRPAMASLAEVEARSDPKLEIQRLVKEQKFDEAFTLALDLNDINVVTWLCLQLNPASVLRRDAPLRQIILLTLVAQLGYDLSTETMTKLTWIREAALLIKPQDPQLSVALRGVLEQLNGNLQRTMQQASGEMASACQLLMHIINSLLFQCPP